MPAGGTGNQIKLTAVKFDTAVISLIHNKIRLLSHNRQPVPLIFTTLYQPLFTGPFVCFQSCANTGVVLNCVPIECTIIGLQGSANAQARVSIVGYIDERFFSVRGTMG